MPGPQRTGKKKPNKRKSGQPVQEYRLRTPRSDQDETFGIVEEIFGGSRMKVRCEDGKIRMGKIRGTMKCRFWVRQGDVVIIRLWSEFQSDDSKATIIWRYTETQAQKLRRQGLLRAFERKPETEIIL